ncbi:1-deoxy-D-xylulose-5-phosphate synthase [Clostridia bacterium]|nr:1-deoxy-D-xylulose-5-phosphate synthase [Clostridia bacterium]
MPLHEKKILCDEIRAFLLRNVPKTGGHLASNLGVVELTVALHCAYDVPRDKIIFDVGHQSYTHKILTGRAGSFGKLRSSGGISGYPRIDESPYDAFIGGHSSISVSAAVGIAAAIRIKAEHDTAHKIIPEVVAVVGDGAFTGGEIFEGLNNIGTGNITIVLNDNGMSISKSNGAFSTYLGKMRSSRKYVATKQKIKGSLSSNEFGEAVSKSVSRTKRFVKNMIIPDNLFENLGLKYYGPVDGHNIAEMTEAFLLTKMIDEPCLIHVKTKKGKGWSHAEENSGKYHSIEPLVRRRDKTHCSSYSEIFGLELAHLGKAREEICAVTAAMKYGTGCNFFAKEFPARFFDVGIAEAHAVTFACGLASLGLVPVFAVYSTFLQRAYDQILHDGVLQKLHIVLAIDRAGLVGEDGETHQGIFDVALLTNIPGTTVFSPGNEADLRLCLAKAILETAGIAAVRYPKGIAETIAEKPSSTLRVFERDSPVLIISYGRVAVTARKLSTDKDYSFIELIQIHPLNPEFDELLEHLLLKAKHVFFIEEVYFSGGIGEKVGGKVKELLIGKEAADSGFHHIAIRDFVPAADIETQLKNCCLDYNSIADLVESFTTTTVPRENENRC